jgi:hypothetical protein
MLLVVLVGLLAVTTMKYRNDYNKAMKLVDALKTNRELSTKANELLQQGYDLMQDKYIALEEKYYTMKQEHDIIFANLEKDPMCLAKAVDAHNDLCSKLEGLDGAAFNVMQNAELLYNSTSKNNYNIETKEITLSLFEDYNNEQCDFLYSYLNNKFGLNLNGSDVRTNTIFTALHELGHYIDYSNKDNIDLYRKINSKQKKAADNIEYGPKCWQAYRETFEESFADYFAIEFMKKHYPELV